MTPLWPAYLCFGLAAGIAAAELLPLVVRPFSYLKAEYMTLTQLLTFLTVELPALVAKIGPLITEVEAIVAEFRAAVPKNPTPPAA